MYGFFHSVYFDSYGWNDLVEVTMEKAFEKGKHLIMRLAAERLETLTSKE